MTHFCKWSTPHGHSYPTEQARATKQGSEPLHMHPRIIHNFVFRGKRPTHNNAMGERSVEETVGEGHQQYRSTCQTFKHVSPKSMPHVARQFLHLGTQQPGKASNIHTVFLIL
jgi:hypothetical protein